MRGEINFVGATNSYVLQIDDTELRTTYFNEPHIYAKDAFRRIVDSVALGEIVIPNALCIKSFDVRADGCTGKDVRMCLSPNDIFSIEQMLYVLRILTQDLEGESKEKSMTCDSRHHILYFERREQQVGIVVAALDEHSKRWFIGVHDVCGKLLSRGDRVFYAPSACVA